MQTLPIGVPTRSFRSPLKRALARAAEAGADGVEVDLRNELRPTDFSQTALRELRRMLEDHRLRVLAATFPTRRPLGDPDDLERRVLAIGEAMAFAYKLGARVLTVRAGAPSGETGADSLAEALRLLGARGERVGVRPALVSGDPPDTQLDLCRRAGDGPVGLSLHPLLLIGRGVACPEAAAKLGAQVAHVYAVDAVGDTSAASGATEVELGRGEADFDEVLATLEEHGYRGPLIVDRTTGPDPVADIENAIAYLRSL
ncbi:sugar phosphate isomerase/epimerase family protein [Botrimarina sp.]|uniref:sugar phosphate isomerase/epimerase family protein n=1 Tax=Botrimarina sp. TaxID=2795802 RepID=UPI0032EC8515